MSTIGVPVKFPHFKAAEANVLRRWLDLAPLQGVIEFDVKLSVPLNPPPYLTTPEEQAIWNHIKSKRIDLTVESDTAIWILEVKDVLRASGIGQLALYAHLYRELFNPSKPIKLGLIAGRNDPSVEAAAKELGITVWLV